MKDATRAEPVLVDDALLRQWPLPMPAAEGDKEERGKVLVIAGSREIAGAAILSGMGVLRAGAGKLAIATAESVAPLLAQAMPEARVIGLPETEDGDLAGAAAADRIGSIIGRYGALLIGPGMQNEEAICDFVAELMPHMDGRPMLLDASAMSVVRGQDDGERPARVSRFDSPVLLTPHAGEMAHLTGADKQEVLDDPVNAALQAARRWNAVVALKGAVTHIAAPDGRLWRHEGGNVGLATSGSGDTLAGIITGLMARGAPLEQACAWGVALHARAGERLCQRLGPLGYLAREILDEIPALMHALRPQ
jgi:hydroxyethylthiazole kinase-like uncharacterized protein yjeF